MSRARTKSVLLGAIVVGAFAAPAWANGGTLLVWASVVHLLIGCALLGVFEGALVAAWARHPRGVIASMLLTFLVF